PRESDDRDRRISAQPERRAAFEVAGGDGAAVRTLAARDFGDARVRGRAEFQPRRAAVRISQGDGAGRTHAAGVSGTFDLEGWRRTLARRHSRQGPEAAPSRA